MTIFYHYGRLYTTNCSVISKFRAMNDKQFNRAAILYILLQLLKHAASSVLFRENPVWPPAFWR